MLKNLSNEGLTTLLNETFERAHGVLTQDEQKKLLDSTVLIVGCGGVGADHAFKLARLGFGRFFLFDPDKYARENISRQAGALESTIGLNKAKVVGATVKDINPLAEVHVYTEGLTEGNIDEAFRKGIDNGKERCILVDGIDLFAMEMRLHMFRKAREYGVYALTAAPLGFGTTLQIFNPKGMTFERYTGIHDGMDHLEMLAAFLTGLNPLPYHTRYMDITKVMLTKQKGVAVASGPAAAAFMVSSAAVNVIVRREKIQSVPKFINLDMGFGIFKSRKGHMIAGKYHPIKMLVCKKLLAQLRKKWEEEERLALAPV